MPKQAVILRIVKFSVLHSSKNVVQKGVYTSLQDDTLEIFHGPAGRLAEYDAQGSYKQPEIKAAE